MEEIDINTLVYKDNIMFMNVPNRIIGEIDKFMINKNFYKLDLSKIKCNKLFYYHQRYK